MLQGFYNLTSSVVCQNRNLDVISNNMVNVSTPGYRKDTLQTSTFQDVLISRRDSNGQVGIQVGEGSMMKVTTGTKTNYTQGTLENTDHVLDFALTKPGFYEIQKADGVAYTRNGSFIIDEEGYLALKDTGRVMGTNGAIKVDTDNIQADSQGNLYDLDNGTYIGTIKVVDFADYEGLSKQSDGTITSNAQGTVVDGGIQWKSLEKSNVNVVQEMTSMMSSQRSIQSATQMIKLYDQLMGKIVSDIGRI